jgi:hypothetical protein
MGFIEQEPGKRVVIRPFVIALKDMKAGTELLLDYHIDDADAVLDNNMWLYDC